MIDHTLSNDAACGSTRWVAQFMGMSCDRFRGRRRNLEAEGFPRPDPVLKLYIKADVQAWLARRRRILDADPTSLGLERPSINLDAL
ncbi:hypothetical protein KM176_06335 [Pseudooceanicola sp. CBS1P-1]|uniref:AlpA family phage regulatory protein n=1 Tax=Pseudooceanicola albus TaxID=2692189 RepID=A0A6L7FWZ9_9RHOB|nr:MULTISPECIES: hypothetical protein [Pseudooceanicola]MBT9383469.1 hypothetical protein [Pseudooceanicola endophyticus]MXN16209.1 hypothetical protein [Pseudooceanicola albus]